MQEGVGGGGAGGAEGGDGAVAVGEERGGEGDARVEVLADEEVAVVERGGREADEELLRPGGGGGDGVELEAVRGVGEFVLGGFKGPRKGGSRIVDLAWLPLGLFHSERVRHGDGYESANRPIGLCLCVRIGVFRLMYNLAMATATLGRFLIYSAPSRRRDVPYTYDQPALHRTTLPHLPAPADADDARASAQRRAGRSHY